MRPYPTPPASPHARDHAPRGRACLAIATLGGALLLAACVPSSPGNVRPSDPYASAAARTLPACTAAQLAFTRDDGNGRFNGMSHSGTALVLRNIGHTACTLPAHPRPQWRNAAGQALQITTQPAAEGQSAAPLTLAPGAVVSSDLRWVSGNVYDGGQCLSPDFISIAIGTHAPGIDFHGHICGPAGQSPVVTIRPFALAPLPDAGAKVLTYTCASGRTVRASYPDTDTAVLVMGGQTRTLHIAISADGARYVDPQWEWWTKGMHDAWLAPLAPGETIASAPGEACTAP